MSSETHEPAYNPVAIKGWGILTIVLGLVFFFMFVFGDDIFAALHPLWDLLRWLASPFI